MRPVSDRFLLLMAEVSATLIGLAGGFASVAALVLSILDIAGDEPA